MLPGHVIQLDHAATAVEHQSKGFHDGPSKQHRSFARQQGHLQIAVLATNAEGRRTVQVHSKLASPPKIKGAFAPHELHQADVILSPLELQHVAQEGTIARQESTGTRIQHGTIMSFTSMVIREDRMAMLHITNGALSRGRLLVAPPPFGTGQL